MSRGMAIRSALSLAAAAGLSMPGQAQSARPATTPEAPATSAIVTVVLANELESSLGVAEIRRRIEGADREIILVRPGTTPENLAWAVRHFSRMRARVGDDLPREARTSVPAVAQGERFTSSELELARDALTRLRNQRGRLVDGLGVRVAVRVTVPAAARR